MPLEKSLIDKGAIKEIEVEEYRDPFATQTYEKTSALILNEEQQLAVEKVIQSVK